MQPIPPFGGILKMAIELTALRLLTQAILGLNYGHHDKTKLFDATNPALRRDPQNGS